MRPLRALILYVVVVFVGGALLAPWLYWLAQHFAGQFPALAHYRFDRFVHRALLGLALIGLWPLLRNLGIRSWRDVGLVRPGLRQWKQAGGGLLLGFLSLALVAVLALGFRARHLNETLSAAQLAQKLGGAALTAMVVAVMEEILFRGGVFGGLRRVFDWRFALLLSSMVYAIVHFLARTRSPEVVYWWSGMQQLGLMLRGFVHWKSVFPGFFNLTLAGVLLGLAYQRTGNLYFSIGLHAGWIFWLKSYGYLTQPAPDSNAWWWGSVKLTDGWLALPVLALALCIFARLSVRTQPELRT